MSKMLCEPKVDDPLKSENRTLSRSVLAQWLQHVEAAPTQLALVDGSSEWSRERLLELVKALASGLHEVGVRAGDRVAIGGQRGASQVAAWWACWWLGAACVPIDAALPAVRIQTMLALCGVRCLLGHALESGVEGVRGLEIHDLAAIGRGRPWPALTSSDLDRTAYVLFTSGSTGEPKGVAVGHRALAQRLAGMQLVMPLAEDDRVLHRTRQGFDVAIEELFWPMAHGAVVVCALHGSDLDAERLLDTVQAHAVTVMDVLPALYDRMLELPALAACTSLRRVLCGGEAMSAALASCHAQVLPGVALTNIYGPTEAVINALWWTVQPGRSGAPPLGQAFPGTPAEVRDPAGRPVVQGQVGELWLSGPLAEGYERRPELTAERFQFDASGRRWYRTGDLVALAMDGLFEFHGRADQQVKLRGARIELGEVEACLTALPTVHQACVMLVGEGRQAHLTAWLVGDVPQSATQWRELLADQLPKWMQPSRFVQLDALPLTATGKVDRSALRRQAEVPATSTCLQAPASTKSSKPQAQLLRRLFCQVLRQRGIGDLDDFFERGGDSLQGMELLGRIEDNLGLVLSLEDLYANSTVQSLCEHINTRPQTHASFNFGRELIIADPAATPYRGSNLVMLRSKASAEDDGLLVCVHPGDGGTSMYLPMLRLMQRTPQVVALAAWDLQRMPEPCSTVQTIAADYVAQLEAAFGTQRPLHLMGWSSGAVLAYEMAVQCAVASRPVCKLGMVDPFEDWELDRELSNSAFPPVDAPFSADDWRMVLSMLALDAVLDSLDAVLLQAPEAQQMAALLHAGQSLGRLPVQLSTESFGYICRVVRRHCHAYDRYRPSASGLDFTLFLPKPPADEQFFRGHWPALTSGCMRTMVVGGEHLTMMRAPFVCNIAAEIDQWFAKT